MRVYTKVNDFLKRLSGHHVNEFAIQCAYYVILSFIPFLILLFSNKAQNLANFELKKATLKLINEIIKNTTEGKIWPNLELFVEFNKKYYKPELVQK